MPVPEATNILLSKAQKIDELTWEMGCPSYTLDDKFTEDKDIGNPDDYFYSVDYEKLTCGIGSVALANKGEYRCVVDATCYSPVIDGSTSKTIYTLISDVFSWIKELAKPFTPTPSENDSGSSSDDSESGSPSDGGGSKLPEKDDKDDSTPKDDDSDSSQTDDKDDSSQNNSNSGDSSQNGGNSMGSVSFDSSLTQSNGNYFSNLWASNNNNDSSASADITSQGHGNGNTGTASFVDSKKDKDKDNSSKETANEEGKTGFNPIKGLLGSINILKNQPLNIAMLSVISVLFIARVLLLVIRGIRSKSN